MREWGGQWVDERGRRGSEDEERGRKERSREVQ